MDKQGERFSESKRRGCPTCAGVDPKSCMRCRGKTVLRNWFFTDSGMEYRKEEIGKRVEG